MKKILLFAFILLGFLVSFSQNLCTTESRIAKLREKYPELNSEWEKWLEGFQQTSSNDEDGNRDVIYIPVVFHVVHNGDAIGTGENISDAQILSQIDVFNEDFNFLNDNTGSIPLEFQDEAANIGIQFCLAKKNPQGQPTTGIVRHEYLNYTDWDEDEIEDVLKPQTIWDRSKYFNIWVCRFGGTLASDGVLAYAQFPQWGSAQTDGVATRFNVVGRVGSLMGGYNKGHTLTHEAGHYFGLLHIWGSDETCSDGGFSGDGIGDTPNQGDLYFGCPSHPQVSCNSNDMFMNFMDYTDDGCKNMFTNGQKTRMMNVINGTRAGLKNNSASCFLNLDAGILEVISPKGSVCNTTISPLVKVKNNGFTTLTSLSFSYQFSGNNSQNFNWNGNIAVNDFAYISLPPSIVSTGNQNLIITITSRNGQNSDDDNANDFISLIFNVTDNGPSTSLPLVETFEGGFFVPGNWSISNPNNDITWVQENSAGGFALSNTSTSIDNFGYTSNPNGKKDQLITDDYTFNGINFPMVSFDLAYAAYSASRFDSLNVYYSLNCGASWIRVWKNGGAGLATAPNTTQLYFPSASEWETINIPLHFLQGQTKVRFRFENVSGWGNKLYLDNINFKNDNTVSVDELNPLNTNFIVYPNPVQNVFVVESKETLKIGSDIEVFNSFGQKVLKILPQGFKTNVDLSQYPNGVYFVKIGNYTQKVLLFR